MRECGAAVRTLHSLHIRRETKRNTQTQVGGGRWRSASAGRGRSAVLPSSDSDRPGGAEAPIIFREIERHDSRAAPVGSKNAIPVAVAVGPSLSHSFRFRDEIEMEWSERAAAVLSGISHSHKKQSSKNSRIVSSRSHVAVAKLSSPAERDPGGGWTVRTTDRFEAPARAPAAGRAG